MPQMFPTVDENGIVVVNEAVEYECRSCHKRFPPNEIQQTTLPPNFNVFPIASESNIPTCPRCGSLAFFGFIEHKGGVNGYE